MKKIIFLVIVAFFVLTTILYSNRSKVQIVDVYVCDVGVMSAQISAKAKVSRKDLYIVGYCKCQGVNKDMMSLVKNFVKECDPKKHMVYSCVCVGKSGY